MTAHACFTACCCTLPLQWSFAMMAEVIQRSSLLRFGLPCPAVELFQRRVVLSAVCDAGAKKQQQKHCHYHHDGAAQSGVILLGLRLRRGNIANTRVSQSHISRCTSNKPCKPGARAIRATMQSVQTRTHWSHYQIARRHHFYNQRLVKMV